MSRRHRLASLCLTVPALVAVAGCGGDDASDPTLSSAASTTSPVGGDITVDLTEYKVTAEPAVATAGKVSFAVANNGAIPHEFVVLKTTQRAAKLLKGSEADETGNVGELDEKALTVGATKDLTLDLKAGHYALICNLPGHYQGGMYLDFTVK